MNPPFAYLAEPSHATAAFCVLSGATLLAPLGLVKLADLTRSACRCGHRAAAPWLRRAASGYLARTGGIASATEAHELEAHRRSALPVEPEDLLAAESAEDDGLWFDPLPAAETVCDVFGPAGFDGFEQMPHRDPDGHVPADVLPEPVEPPEVDLFGGPPSPAEISEAARYVVVVANRIAREAAQGGAK